MPVTEKTPTPLIDTHAVADWLGVPPRTLDQWAYRQIGPPFAKVGRHRRYDPVQVQDWIDRRTTASGSDAA